MIIIPHEFDFLWLFRFFSLHDRVFNDKGHHIPAEIFHAQSARRRDQIIFIFPTQRLSDRFRFLFGFCLIQQVDLVED